MANLLWENIVRGKAKEIRGVLKENILFKDLSPKELQFVANIIHLRKYRAGEVIFHQDELGLGMYIIVSGSVNITVDDIGVKDKSAGNELVIAKLESGDFFGDTALVEENAKRSATATANENTNLIGFFRPNMLEILERNPRAGVKITLRLSEVLEKRLKKTTKRVSLLEKQLKQFQTISSTKQENE